jgi:hypothetical protein
VDQAGLPAGVSVDAASTPTNVILTGPASLADYQAALQQIRFGNTSETPDATPRQISFIASDGITNSASAVAVISIDRAPDAVADSAATVLDTSVTTSNVLANDDQGDAPARIVAFDALSAFGGTVAHNGDGTFTYTPASGFVGSDSFTYTIADNDGDQSSALVALSVASSRINTFEKRIIAESDDVEEGPSGAMTLTSSDLELVDDGTRIGQVVGLPPVHGDRYPSGRRHHEGVRPVPDGRSGLCRNRPAHPRRGHRRFSSFHDRPL